MVDMVKPFLVLAPFNLNKVSMNILGRLLVGVMAVCTDGGLWLDLTAVQSSQGTCGQSAVADGNEGKTTVPVHSRGHTDLFTTDATIMHFLASFS